MQLTQTKDGTIITFFVKPNQPQFKIAFDGNEIIVHSTEEPVKGKVNKELLKEFTKLFHAKATFVSGLTSKQKHILIAGLSLAEVQKILDQKPRE
jgi:uncharacterized protein (TIGR00251 family)